MNWMDDGRDRITNDGKMNLNLMCYEYVDRWTMDGFIIR